MKTTAMVTTRLHGGPADGIEVQVRKRQHQVLWHEDVPVQFVEEDELTATAGCTPIHVYDLKTWGSGNFTESRYEHSGKCPGCSVREMQQR